MGNSSPIPTMASGRAWIHLRRNNISTICTPAGALPGEYGMRNRMRGEETRMLEFNLPKPAKNILCLGAHADDIEIGCGGTILKWIHENPDLKIYWVVFSGEDTRGKEARSSARVLLQKTRQKVIVKQFKTSF